MKRTCLVLLALAVSSPASPQTAAPKPASKSAPAVRYGDNAAAGRTFVHDGLRLYFEVYGTGEPLLLVHGNGGSIAACARRLRISARRYQVIAMDSRDQGQSADSPDESRTRR